jgi:hypothetical protein
VGTLNELRKFARNEKRMTPELETVYNARATELRAMDRATTP